MFGRLLFCCGKFSLLARTRIRVLRLMKNFTSVSKQAIEWKNLNTLLIECKNLI